MLTTTTLVVTESPHPPAPTTFTPPESCTKAPPYVTVIDTLQVLFPDTYQATSAVRTECFPPNYAPTAYISPAPYCPVGYTAACENTSGPSTSAICCPTGGWSCVQSGQFSLKTTIDLDQLPCYKLFTAGEIFTSALFAAASITFSGPATLQPSASLNGFAYGVHILWQSSDVPPGATPAVTSVRATGGSMPSGQVFGGSGLKPSTEQQDLEMMRLQIGLGVGIPLFCILVAIAIFIPWFRTRQARNAVRDLVPDDEKIFGKGYGVYSGGRESQTTNTSQSKRGSGRASGGQALGFSIGKRRRSREQSPTRNNGIGVIPPAPAYPTKPPKHTRTHESVPSVDLQGISQVEPQIEPQIDPQVNLQANPPMLAAHNRSMSEPLTSLTASLDMRPSTTHSPPPQLSFSPLAMSPLLPPRPSTVNSNHTELSAGPSLGSALLASNHDVPMRPQSPAYAVHTELWRQQQHQWILDERRNIADHYERLRREQQDQNEEVRDAIRKKRERKMNSPDQLHRHLRRDFGS